METWRIRQGVPYPVSDGDRELLVGLDDFGPERAHLSVFSEGQWVTGFELAPGDECEIAGKRWLVSSISDGPRPYLELKEQA
ncbi:hypothetical protein [Streptomyces sp. SID13031]|uniref:hypothetical protein n=1 Tax=Streptomyces sp. SID13031 TaxID=2706046 RepID=UPI0013C8913C|nr:hypothetical protein [Streptomyces sp. SID13031]NEA35891.1 hypothetical protein [Streptomyces sp. SID13031]